ncbi:hypothetical protein HN911_13450 [Candidatus Bathyarchaeota archaeon]|jgi:hypothetical protein|nr:hypothetical protein [Candidatus Bathyarchaeota archaeon]
MAITRIQIREKKVPRKRIHLGDIRALDRKKNFSNLRWLEMTIEQDALSQGVVLQFFRDLTFYGIYEAMAYARGYAEKGEYREGFIEKIEEIITKVETAIAEGKEIQ